MTKPAPESQMLSIRHYVIAVFKVWKPVHEFYLLVCQFSLESSQLHDLAA